MFRCLNSLATNRTRQPSPSVCACVPIESKWQMITAAGLPFQSATLLPLQLLLRRLSLRRLLQVATLQLRLQAVIVRLLHRKVRDAISPPGERKPKNDPFPPFPDPIPRQ
ncbi:uncharacterized protein [Zea mays]|uniref:uncharacterized protein isoform X1 n=1 Tax=Zea mays TaxID=4577 RepID=UPI0009A9ACA7|nr:uncharacterized protein LOC103629808 isoform X1 [Zea mays]|eukprot:XP_020395001.1 uncharacterized protein LOC103629808 isoform X1 [Zea mays]